LKRLSVDENNSLIALFSLEEMEWVNIENDREKTVRPYDFNFAFTKEFWYLLKEEVKIKFDQFHDNETLSKEFVYFWVVFTNCWLRCLRLDYPR